MSIGKLRAASLFTIIYLFAENVPSLRVARLLALTLICGVHGQCFFHRRRAAAGTRGKSLWRFGAKVRFTKRAFAMATRCSKSTDRKLSDPQELVNALSQAGKEPAAVLTYRHELQPVFKIPRGSCAAGQQLRSNNSASAAGPEDAIGARPVSMDSLLLMLKSCS